MSAIELETHRGLQGGLTSPRRTEGIGSCDTGFELSPACDQLAEEVLDRARRAIAKSPILGIRGIRVEVRDRHVLLFGEVDSFYHKQQAQEAIRVVSHGFLVINHVEVISESALPPGRSVR
jgi:BON domain